LEAVEKMRIRTIMTPFLVLVMGIAMLLGAACSSGKATDNSASATEDKSTTTPVVDTTDTKDTLFTEASEVCLTLEDVRTILGSDYTELGDGTTATFSHPSMLDDLQRDFYDGTNTKHLVCSVIVCDSESNAQSLYDLRGHYTSWHGPALDLGDACAFGYEYEYNTGLVGGIIRIDNAVISLTGQNINDLAPIEAMLRVVASKR
jgi:hypothetical protein